MDLLKTLMRVLLREFDAPPGDLLREAVRARMESRIPLIVAGMEGKGAVLERAGKRFVIRDALFRLWRQAIPSGDLADFVRDAQDDKVLALVEPRIELATPLADVVRLTMDAALELMF